MLARAPAAQPNIALVELDSLRQTTFLHGDPSWLGHFYVELANGERYLDAHLEGLTQVSIAVPEAPQIFVRTQEGEAALSPADARQMQLDKLRLRPLATASRGSIDAAYRTELFAAPLTESYYKGFVDSQGASSVVFSSRASEHARGPSYLAPALSLAASGAATIVAATAFGLALDARADFRATTVQRSAYRASERYATFRTTSWVAGGVALALGLVSWYLWPTAPAVIPSPAAVNGE